MQPRFQSRRSEILPECRVPPAMFNGITERLIEFAEPYARCLLRPEQRQHAQTYLQGLLSDLQRKNSEAIAYRHDEDRQGLQIFIGQSPWDHRPLLKELAVQVADELGEPDGILVFDPSAFAKKGNRSVGVARQWCGRLGKEENCQVAVFLGYVSREQHTLIDMRLYLPEEWTKDRSRCKAAGIPRGERRFRTRHQLALEMLDAKGPLLPHGWIAGDAEMGRPAWFRRKLDERGERYLLAVPSNITIRDLDAEPPSYGGRGSPRKVPFVQVRDWCDALPDDAWTTLQVRDGTKGPIEVRIVRRRVRAKIDNRIGPEEMLVVIRGFDEEGKTKIAYCLSNASPETPLSELARVANAEHRIEECIKRGKSEAGMAQYQARNWRGWHHHITLCLIATWFLLLETRRGKKMDTDVDGTAGSSAIRADIAWCLGVRHARPDTSRVRAMAASQPACRVGTS